MDYLMIVRDHRAQLLLLLTQKTDEGNVVILVNTVNYVNKMNSILENKNKSPWVDAKS